MRAPTAIGWWVSGVAICALRGSSHAAKPRRPPPPSRLRRLRASTLTSDSGKVSTCSTDRWCGCRSRIDGDNEKHARDLFSVEYQLRSRGKVLLVPAFATSLPIVLHRLAQ